MLILNDTIILSLSLSLFLSLLPCPCLNDMIFGTAHFNGRAHSRVYVISIIIAVTIIIFDKGARGYTVSEIYNVNYGTRFDNATRIRISDAQQCQTISAIVAITVLIIAFTNAPVSTMVMLPNRRRYIVTTSQYNDATTPILFSGSTTLSAITVEMNNAWKRGETAAEGKSEPVKSSRRAKKKKRDGTWVRKRETEERAREN